MKPDDDYAFPREPTRFEPATSTQNGMTLRDYFAAKAMDGLISAQKGTRPTSEIALDAYNVADAVLAERAK
jgi:hypothetical protein